MLAYLNAPNFAATVKLDDVGEPGPQPDEAVIEVRAFSVNRGELALIASRPEGWRPCQDLAGIVVQAADDGSGPPVGTHVAALVEGGAWAERIAIRATRLVELGGVDFVQAAGPPLAGLTALRLTRLGGPLLGRRVLITGASGAVGSCAVQLAALQGADVTAVASAHSAERVKAGGATAVVEAVEQADGRYELILESIGGASLTAAIAKVTPGGTIVSFGNSSNEQASFDLLGFFGAEGARIETFFSYASFAQKDPTADLRLLVDLVNRGKLDIGVGSACPWEELPETLGAMRNRTIRGKAVLTIDQR